VKNMRFASQLNWFAVHAKRFRETLGAASVSALGVEVFLPLASAELARNSVIKHRFIPLFPGYFFARLDPQRSLEPVEASRGVLYVVKAGAFPIPVDERVLEELKERMGPDGLITIQPPEIRMGDRVSIREGAFAGMAGKVVAEPDDRRRVTILLETLWQARVLIATHGVEAQAA
jgi:transcriptional antiterminator RfaH